VNTLQFEVRAGRELSSAEHAAVRSLCSLACEEDYGPALRSFTGATHVLGKLDGRLVSHALWIRRHLQPGGHPPLRTAYVEGVATHPDFQRRGFGTAVMREVRRVLEGVADFELAALSPAQPEWYGRLGWERWRGPLFIRTPAGRPATPDEEVMIRRLPRTPPLNLGDPLSAEWREGELW